MAYALNRVLSETDLRATYSCRFGCRRSSSLAAISPSWRRPGRRTIRNVAGGAGRRRGLLGMFLSPEIVDEIETFVAGDRPPVVPSTVLTTVLFTDIVGSTERARELGDRAWRRAPRASPRLVRRELARFRGGERDTAGDGFFATFDGPARAIRCAQAILEGDRRASVSSCVRGCTPGECELHEGKVAGNRGLRRFSRRCARSAQVRCSCPARSATSSPARGSSSRTAESTS